jgi:hypothetical protein
MTNGQHDELWAKGAKSLPRIETALRTANAIACLKEIFMLGEMSKEEYVESLKYLINQSGYTINKPFKEEA